MTSLIFMKKFRIFSGSANHALAKKVAQNLKMDLGKVEIVRFADGECRVRLEEEVEGKTVFVLQSLCPPVDENLVELCLLADTLKRNGAQKLIAVVPYLGYARQDKVNRKGECLSTQVVARIIESVGFEKLIAVDVHSEKALSFFKIPTENLLPDQVLAEAVSSDKKNCLAVSPDEGALKRVRQIAKILGTTVVSIDKERDLLTGKLKIKGVKGDASGQNLIIFDDMITSGGTLIIAADFLARQKAAGVLACATHGLLVKDAPLALQKSEIKKVIVTDTVPVPKEKQFKKLEIVTVAPLIARAIENSV